MRYKHSKLTTVSLSLFPSSPVPLSLPPSSFLCPALVLSCSLRHRFRPLPFPFVLSDANAER